MKTGCLVAVSIQFNSKVVVTWFYIDLHQRSFRTIVGRGIYTHENKYILDLSNYNYVGTSIHLCRLRWYDSVGSTALVRHCRFDCAGSKPGRKCFKLINDISPYQITSRQMRFILDIPSISPRIISSS